MLKLKLRNLIIRLLPFLVTFLVTAGATSGEDATAVAWAD